MRPPGEGYNVREFFDCLPKSAIRDSLYDLIPLSRSSSI